MSWRQEKTENGSDLVYDGAELGIASSPTAGTANIQNANISTEIGEVMASFSRSAQQQTALSNQTLTPSGATDFTGPATLKAGTWIRVSASTVTSITAATSPSTVDVDYLVVAGGGGGGNAFGAASGAGGGGAGAVRTGTLAVSATSYPITVGEGGAGATSAATTNEGEDSVFSTITSVGGGAGANANNPCVAGTNGGSGGGGAGDQGSGTTGAAGTGTTGGNNGGAGRSATAASGGGGGGAGAVGSAGASGVGGNGGAGTASSITGTSVTYGGGGGGGGATAGTATGGGGAGGNGAGTGEGNDATANTGGGGGGAFDDSSTVGGVDGGNGASGIVVISYPKGSMVATGGDITYTATNVVHTFREDGLFTVHSIATGGLYYVSYKSGTTFRLSSKFDPTGANALTHGTTGSITFSTVAVPNSMLAKATEKYTTATAVEYRYYMLDINGYVWVYDSFIYDTYGTQWMLPDPANYSTLKFAGLGVLNGWCMVVSNSTIYGKPTTDLGRQFSGLTDVVLNEPFPTHNNYVLVGNQGKMYYADGNYIGELFPTTSLLTSIANIQSYCKYTSSSTTGTISSIIGGSLPYSPEGTRIPVVFFTDQYGTLPTAITEGTVYYIQYNPLTSSFEVHATIGPIVSPIDIATGASGNQYFNTFYPYGLEAGVNGTDPLVQWSSQRVNLPANEVAQCMVEIGNTVLIGGVTNTIYPWNQVDATPSDFITLPEANVKSMINVNNVAYVFAGNKGNVYITNGSQASLTLKVADYLAGVPGTPFSYIEPVFTWGDSMYCRGRVYFSILDQTATKAGNCGGIWSFVPIQNIDPNQQIGMALRLENQSSYADYDGVSTILLPNEEQNAIAPQYWSAWQDSYSTGTSSFGIDGTGSTPVTQYVIETDIVPSGTQLAQRTFSQVEYKVTTPLLSGDSIQVYYRLNATDAWTSCGTVIEEPLNRISGYFTVNFQKTQWVHFRIIGTTGGTTASSFTRFKELRLR